VPLTTVDATGDRPGVAAVAGWTCGEGDGPGTGLCTGTVRAYLLRCGGIMPLPRRRGAGRLRLEEREEISRSLAAGLSYRLIADALGRSASTVSREVAANGGTKRYRAARADQQRLTWLVTPRPSIGAVQVGPPLTCHERAS
jgi:DNA-binding CsgD family transcriptional regulator